MDRARAIAALAPLRPAFDADGIALQVESATDERVRVRLNLRDATCAECVMPRPHLERLLAGAFAQAGLGAVIVELVGMPGEGEPAVEGKGV